MKKLLSLLLLFPLLLLLPCCAKDADTPDTPDTEPEEALQDNAGLTATVTALSDKLEVNVIDGDHGATGVYWVITSDSTLFFDADGNEITRDDVQIGDTVEIRYTGQVMMSYPPQIVAVRVTVIK